MGFWQKHRFINPNNWLRYAMGEEAYEAQLKYYMFVSSKGTMKLAPMSHIDESVRALLSPKHEGAHLNEPIVKKFIQGLPIWTENQGKSPDHHCTHYVGVTDESCFQPIEDITTPKYYSNRE